MRNRIIRDEPGAGLAFDLVIVSARVLMLAHVAILSAKGLLRF